MRIMTALILLFNFSISAKDIRLNNVRILYQQSTINEESCKKLINDLSEYNEHNNPTLAAYKACVTMMMAKYTFNPVEKLGYFNRGKNILEKCIKAEKDNIEIRYLRFTIQSNAPDFLGYNSSIFNDKTFLLNAISDLENIELKKIIIAYLKSSEYLSADEKLKLKS